MNERTTLEVIAPTVEEAIQQGLSQLGLTADAVSVEVLCARLSNATCHALNAMAQRYRTRTTRLFSGRKRNEVNSSRWIKVGVIIYFVMFGMSITKADM